MQIFSILDTERVGSISMNQFIQAYRKSENYQKLSEEKKREADDEIT